MMDCELHDIVQSILEQMGVLRDEKFESKKYRTSYKNAETGDHFASLVKWESKQMRVLRPKACSLE